MPAPLQPKPFSPEPADISADGFAAFPLEGCVERILSSADAPPHTPTQLNRDLYLDLCERIVRMACPWVDAAGAVIDPVTGEEWRQTTPRFVSSAAVLISFGRCREHLETVYRAMSHCCKRLSDGSAKTMSADFWPRELMTAYLCLDGIAPEALQEMWRNDLSAVNGEAVYMNVDPAHGEKLKTLHNWVVYSSAGEGLRDVLGLCHDSDDILCGKDFFNTYMAAQLHHMTDYGMYRDPGDPITYDITTRLQFCVPLAYGLQTPLRPVLEELQRRGGLTALLFTSADGYTPYGGRSAQFQFQEAITSALFELEASRYKNTNPRLAGAFKAQAGINARATTRWLLGMSPPRHLKNGFDPHARHGIDDYGQYSVYSLLCASFFGLAALFADDTIAKATPPSHTGGYVFELYPAFHKIFAACGGTYVQIDTAADAHYDATGIGRIHFSGTPLEMILGMPAPSDPLYSVAEGEQFPKEPVAIAPLWQSGSATINLAALGAGELEHTLEVHSQSAEAVSFTVHYTHADSGSDVRETLTLHEGRVSIRSAITVNGTTPAATRYRVPVIVSDGHSHSTTELSGNTLRISYRQHHCEIRWPAAQATASLLPETFANRNARYQLLELDFGNNPAELTIVHCRE